MRRRLILGNQSSALSMTIDINNRDLNTTINKEGYYEDITELVLTGNAKAFSAANTFGTEGVQWSTHFPSLKRLLIIPDTYLSYDGVLQNNFKFAHYVFNDIPDTLEYLQIGKLGGAYFTDGGYFRNDMPVPPGNSRYEIGSESGLELTVYMNTYSATGGFIGGLAPNTILHCLNWETGEEIFA